MNNQEIFELMDHFGASSATRLKLTMGDFSLELEKGTAPAAAAAAPAQPIAVSSGEDMGAEGLFITAPLVGTFYAAPSPGAAPFVQAGDTVRRGQTVCLLEAMKMMSEVKSPCDCVVEAVLAKDGALVSYGENLIRYREG